MKHAPSRAASIERRFPSRLREVDAACLELRGFLQTHGLAARLFPIEVTVRECLNNAVLHGNKRKASLTVSFSVRLGPRWLRVSVADEGPGFAWRRRACLPGTEAWHGRGKSILTLHTSKVSHNRRGNSVTLWFERGPASNPQTPQAP